MVDSAIVKAVQNYLHRLAELGVVAQLGVLFGSHVTGRTHEWSDIDLLVVSEAFEHMRDRTNINLMWRATIGTDSRIEPIACGER